MVQDHIPLVLGTLAMTAMKVMKKALAHTFDEGWQLSSYTLTATDSTGETATDTLEIAVEESSADEEPPATEPLTG